MGMQVVFAAGAVFAAVALICLILLEKDIKNFRTTH